MIVALLLIPALVLVPITARRVRRYRHRRRAAAPPASRCACGYDLAGLDTIRCPECGRVFGFDATPEQLGLTREELARAKARRDLCASGLRT